MFHVATPEQIKSGKVTDVYFERTVSALRRRGIKKHVLAEVRATSLPEGYEWAVFAGVEEAAELLRGIPADVKCLPEGTIFAHEPVLTIEGEYTDWGIYETPLLGLLCQASGVATKAARCRLAAEHRTLISFGARRMHPALAPMIERNAYIGGCDGVATVITAELISIAASGTMPHALILVMGNAVEAFLLYQEESPPGAPLICLVDTLCDEKFEAMAAAGALGRKLDGVRLDTPGSRRGDMLKILEEVRWELNLRGYERVQLIVSGGVDEHEILRLNQYADGYGVGTSISNAPTINFALDIVEVEGKPFTKRGKMSGRKSVLYCPTCNLTRVVPAGKEQACRCGGEDVEMLQPLTRGGALVRDLPPATQLRTYVMQQLVQRRVKLAARQGIGSRE